MSIKHGTPKSVKEIVCTIAAEDESGRQSLSGQASKQGCSLGDSVRTVGRLKSVLSVETVILEDEGHELCVDVSLSSPCGFKQNRQYQFIGELEDRRNSMGGEGANNNNVNTLILVARIARDVTGLDMDLYRRGLVAQEQCLAKTRQSNDGSM